jgi:hypothetical protein
MITIDEMWAAIKPILAAVEITPGTKAIKLVLDDYPDAFQTRELPALVPSPQDATYDRETYGADSLLIRRLWQLRLYVAEADMGREFQNESATKPFLDAIPLALAAYPELTISDGGDHDGESFELHLDQGGDTGAKVLRYNSKFYAGALFRIYTVTHGRFTPIGTL